MSLPTDQSGSAEFDQSEWLQFEIPDLDGYDFTTFEVPSLSPLGSLPNFEPLPTKTAAQSLNIKPSPPSPRPQPKRAPVITAQRRSSNRSNEALTSVTLEDPSGRKRSWDVSFENACEAWRNINSAEQKLTSIQPQITLPPTILSPQSIMPRGHQISHMSSHAPSVNPSYQIAAPWLDMGQQSFGSSPQLVPLLSRPPMAKTRRAGRVPASGQTLQRQPQRPADMRERQKARKRLQSSEQDSQRELLGGRASLPDGIALFVNPHHLPSNHGRVPDKRGNKDTTVANDYYYSISNLKDLALPTSEKVVSYNGIEFDPGLYFTSHELLEYLRCASQRPNRQPILRIQIQPAQYNHRYMRAGQSFKCRFAGCPDKRGTILKGQARVCISEFDDEHGDWLNPFHNAGYVHLFCLEQQVNLIELCNGYFPGLTVVPETRSLAHEPPATTNLRLNNPMALNDVERAVVVEWLAEIGKRWDAFKSVHRDLALRPAFELAQEDTLTYRLTKAHMDNQQLRNIQKKRKRDAGGRVTAHLDDFVGDVGKQVALQKKMKEQPPPTKKQTGTGKISSSPESPHATRRRTTSPPPPSPTPMHSAMRGDGNQAQPQPDFSELANNGDKYAQ